MAVAPASAQELRALGESLVAMSERIESPLTAAEAAVIAAVRRYPFATVEVEVHDSKPDIVRVTEKIKLGAGC